MSNAYGNYWRQLHQLSNDPVLISIVSRRKTSTYCVNMIGVSHSTQSLDPFDTLACFFGMLSINWICSVPSYIGPSSN